MKRKHSAYYLMSLANKPTKELVSLMRDNSFLFPVCADTYEVFEGDTYSINDCIYGSYALNIQDYNNISVDMLLFRDIRIDSFKISLRCLLIIKNEI